MVLRNMGFPERFVAWVEGLHEGTTTKPLINGWLSEGIQVRSGVRQGCPLAPYIFLCAVEPLAQLAEKRKLGLSLAEQRLAYLGYADDTTLVLQGKCQIKKAVRALAKFAKESGLAMNKGKSVVMLLGVNLTSNPIASDGFKWAAADEAEHLLGVWITPNGSCRPTWEKALEDITGKLQKWHEKYLTKTARGAVVNNYISPKISFLAEVYPPPDDIWLEIDRSLHNFVSANRPTSAKGFILWRRELVYLPRDLGGLGVRDPGILLACLSARRAAMLATETNLLKKDIIIKAAELPMGLDSFTAHRNHIRYWKGHGTRWKMICETILMSPLGERPLAEEAGDVAREPLLFNRRILPNGKTPLGGQIAAAQLKDWNMGKLRCTRADGAQSFKTLEQLKTKLEEIAPARLALKALEAAPEEWKKVLVAAGGISSAASQQQQLPYVSSEGIFSLKQMRRFWGSGQASNKQEKWASRWGTQIDWRKVIAIRDSRVVPNRPRSILLRIHGLNLQALRMINPARRISSLGYMLFKRAGSDSAFPEATLTAIGLHQI
ncbi:unnamed protein product [Closterium sp. NIES-65]|nr:unnamed protein product [Closterium sp. NIES-65]